jgi:hypothetical protein
LKVCLNGMSISSGRVRGAGEGVPAEFTVQTAWLGECGHGRIHATTSTSKTFLHLPRGSSGRSEAGRLIMVRKHRMCFRTSTCFTINGQRGITSLRATGFLLLGNRDVRRPGMVIGCRSGPLTVRQSAAGRDDFGRHREGRPRTDAQKARSLMPTAQLRSH